MTTDMTPPKNILAFGEILWDLLPDGPVLGGAPFNFTYRVGSLGHRALIASRLGQDALGQRAFAQLQQLRLDPELIQWHDTKPTGTVPIQLDANGVPDYNILPDVAYDDIEPSENLLGAAAVADCFCFGTLIQRTDLARQTLYRALEASPRSLKLLDVNLRRDCYTPETVRESLRRADILKLNEDEVRYVAELLGIAAAPLTSFAPRAMDQCGLTHCVITLGPRGVFAANAEGDQHYEPGRAVTVKDTTGAGDGLTAAFTSALLRGRPLAECCRVGNAMGSLVATQAGATTPVSDDDLTAFLKAPPAPLIEASLRTLLKS